MNFWTFLDKLVNRLPGWPSERQFIASITFVMGFAMLVMARNDAALWTVELFKTLITVVIVTGCVNMILSFHFAANKNDEDKTVNTAKAFDAITATANAAGASDPNAIREGDSVTLEKQ